MDERERLIKGFRENFIEQSNAGKSIVLYGLGKNTEIILSEFAEAPIVGLLDGYHTSGEIYGKRIMALNEICQLDCIIIIVARSGAQKVIYHRIKEFCNEYGIDIFNQSGEKFGTNDSVLVKNHPYFSLDVKNLERAIDEHDIVSFDIFDTLLTRMVMYPEDVFRIVAEKLDNIEFDYIAERIRAEKEISCIGIPDIYEIYNAMARNTNFNIDNINLIMEIEIETEKEILIRREAMIKAMEYAIHKRKVVYLISDMYFPKEILQDILRQKEISGYMDILVSCDYKSDKRHELFEKYKNKLREEIHLEENNSLYRLLHIGDDEIADGICANENGIDTFLIKSPYEMSQVSVCRGLFEKSKNYNDNIMLGLFVNKMFQNPFIQYQSAGKLVIRSAYEYGYLFIAPVIMSFTMWLVNRLQENKYDKILFISRDGYLPMKAYQTYLGILTETEKNRMPDAEYFLISRTLGIAASIESEEDIVYAAELSFDGTITELLRKRFQISEENSQLKYDKDKKVCSIANKESILKRSAMLKDNYLQYIKASYSFDVAKKDTKIAIFDFVSTGTCQMCLEKILKKRFTGFYYSHIYENYKPKKELNIFSYITRQEIKDNVENNYFMIENFIKEPKPSLISMDDSANPIFGQENRKRKHLDAIRAVQQSVEDYMLDYFKIHNKQMLNIEQSQLPNEIFSYSDEEHTMLFIKEFANYKVRDEFCNRIFNLN